MKPQSPSFCHLQKEHLQWEGRRKEKQWLQPMSTGSTKSLGIPHLLWSHLDPAFLWVPAMERRSRFLPKHQCFCEAQHLRQLCFPYELPKPSEYFASSIFIQKKKCRNEESSSGLKQRRRKQPVLSFWWIFLCREDWISSFSRYHLVSD